METYKWYVDEEAQQIDIFAIWGVTIVKTAIAGATMLVVGSALAAGFTSVVVVFGVVVVIGAGVVVSFFVGVILDAIDEGTGATESFKKVARSSSVEEQLESRLPPLKPVWQR